MSGPGFAVIDVETTGLFPEMHDRIVEIAIVHVDADGSITGSWETLLNPQRDLGPQHIHQIRAAEILSAPTFGDIAPELVRLLSGRVIVAHNASFDIRFLDAELSRIGYQRPAQVEPLCTMRLAREFLPGAGRSLSDCCAHYDIELDRAHRASVDAIATAHLLACYISASPGSTEWSRRLAQNSVEWPPLAPNDIAWVSRDHAVPDPAHFLERITVKLPEHAGPAEQHDYLALLDRCLLDRVFSAHEADELVAEAERLGISRTTCVELHTAYFDHVARLAWSDSVLTGDEQADLAQVARLLAIPDERLRVALSQPTTGSVSTPGGDETAGLVTFRLSSGDLIVLTGEMARPRTEWSAELVQHGYVPWEAVTKKVKLLAAADPDSLSGKARKAREYGITIVGEDGLAKLIAQADVS